MTLYIESTCTALTRAYEADCAFGDHFCLQKSGKIGNKNIT